MIKTLAFLLLLLTIPVSAHALPFQWATSSIPTNQQIVDVIPTEQGFLAFGLSGGVYSTTNGLDWQDVSPPISGALTAALAENGQWMVLGPEVGLWASDNSGQSWQQIVLPELDDEIFQPIDIARQFTDTLVVIGKYGDPFACRTSAIVSSDGLDWSIVPEGNFFFEQIDTQPTNVGLLNFVFYDNPRCGGVMPLISPYGYFYFEGTAETGFGSSGFGAQIWTPDRNVIPDVFIPGYPKTSLFEAGWFDETFWALDRNFITDLPPFAVRRMTPPEFTPFDEVSYFDDQPFSLTDYDEGVLISHQGLVSFVDLEGNVEQQTLPETEAWYRLASSNGLVVGVSPDGSVIRGGLPGNAFPINATHPISLIVLFMLILCIAYSQYRPN